MEKIEPTEPIDMKDPTEPTDMKEPALSSDAALVIESVLDADRAEPALAIDSTLPVEAREAIDFLLALEARLPPPSGACATIGLG